MKWLINGVISTLIFISTCLCQGYLWMNLINQWISQLKVYILVGVCESENHIFLFLFIIFASSGCSGGCNWYLDVYDKSYNTNIFVWFSGCLNHDIIFAVAFKAHKTYNIFNCISYNLLITYFILWSLYRKSYIIIS